MRWLLSALLLFAAGRLVAADSAAIRSVPQPDDENAVAELEKLGAQITKDEHDAVNRVVFGYARATDSTLIHLKGLHRLESLGLPCITKVTDAGLKHLEGLRELRSLYIGYSNISDRGLTYLEGMENLEELAFSMIKIDVTDAGLEHLKRLRRLRKLHLGAAHVTEAGVLDLQRALPNCKITWRSPTKDERPSPTVPDRRR